MTCKLKVSWTSRAVCFLAVRKLVDVSCEIPAVLLIPVAYQPKLFATEWLFLRFLNREEEVCGVSFFS